MKRPLHKTVLLALFSAVGLALVTPADARGGVVIPPPVDPLDPPVVSKP